ncbi:MAG: DUF1329 domain-containing protein, partial [Pseudomonadota bacterium]
SNTKAEVSYGDIETWINNTVTATPLAPDTVVTRESLAALDPWVAPGLRDEFDFPELSIEIQATIDYPPHQSYRAATERFAGEATLGADNTLQNYTAGKPFSDEQLEAVSPEQAGFMVAWNQFHRWQYTGYQIKELTMTYIDAVAGGENLDPEFALYGGGQITRRLHQAYHRVYLSHLAWLPNAGYRFDVPDSDTRYFKDYIEFLAPFDVKGTSFVVERHLDPLADDQVNIYSPTERRVRRFSAKERADRFMGSEATLDDFEGFSGRVMDYRWKYLGTRAILMVADAKNPINHGIGPYSRFPGDRWQIRDCYVVEVKSTWEAHPYGSRVLFFDKQTMSTQLSLIFDHDGKLWKTMIPIFRGPTENHSADYTIETSVASWRGQFNVDRQSNTSTVVQAITNTTHPTMTKAKIKRKFSVSNLSSGR